MHEYKLVKLNLARNSLRYIIRTFHIKKINVPYYICNTIIQGILKEHCKPVFYHIDDNFMPSKEFAIGEYILYPNYFGICDNNIKYLCKKYSKIIVDNAHSFFAKPNGFATFNSVRKFLPVFNGSYLWIQEANLKIEQETSILNYDIRFENDFENYPICLMSKNIEKFLDNISEEKIKQQRKEKFMQYHFEYKKYNTLNIKFFDTKNIICPFCYPLLLENELIAEEIVKDLEKKRLTIYRYWNNLPQNYNEYKFYRKLIPIPLIK